jgi:hypothetical protein
MMRKYLLFGFFILLTCQACKEKYIPSLDEPDKILVVEGRITDEPGPQTITLTDAVPFNKDQSFPEMGAIVTVLDENKYAYTFRETFPGVYVSNSAVFHPTVGSTYTLLIKTNEGKSYVSTPQVLQPKGKIDTIYSAFKSVTFQTDVNNTSIFSNEPGIEFLTSMDLSKDNSPYYRFSSSLLIEFITRYSFNMNVPYCCWLTYMTNDFINLVSQDNKSQKVEHEMGFVPTDTFFYSMVKQRVDGNPPGTFFWIYKYPHSFQISFKEYHINKDVYDYYNSMDIQLQAKDRIFDPVAYQFKGNMVCIEKPNEVVLGVFEVASVQLRTFLFDPYHSKNSLNLIEQAPLEIENLTANDCQRRIVPYFWTLPLDTTYGY